MSDYFMQKDRSLLGLLSCGLNLKHVCMFMSSMLLLCFSLQVSAAATDAQYQALLSVYNELKALDEKLQIQTLQAGAKGENNLVKGEAGDKGPEGYMGVMIPLDRQKALVEKLDNYEANLKAAEYAVLATRLRALSTQALLERLAAEVESLTAEEDVQ